MIVRRKLLFAAQIGLFLLLMGTLYHSRDYLARIPRPSFGLGPNQDVAPQDTTEQHESLSVLSSENITTYVKAIMDPEDTTLPRLECPRLQTLRYESLKAPPFQGNEIDFFFAIDLRETLTLLPRLIGSVVEAIRFLGPEACALSIVEGNSGDGTAEVLRALRPTLDALTTTYYFKSSDIDPSQGNRIAKLAELRNLALGPLLDEAHRYSTNTTIIFLNDVALCLEDILELVYQRSILAADMTCAMDWTYVGRDPTFYDIWIARGMNGDSFFEIPPDGNWNSAWNLFWNDPDTKAKFNAHKPFQVFACWNGAAVFTAQPIVQKEIAFRAPANGECLQGEPQLFCKDLWFHGYRRIAVVPSVNLEYSNERGKDIKDLKGYTSKWVGDDDAGDDQIQWQVEPPELVKCIPSSYENQTFLPWNESLTQR